MRSLKWFTCSGHATIVLFRSLKDISHGNIQLLDIPAHFIPNPVADPKVNKSSYQFSGFRDNPLPHTIHCFHKKVSVWKLRSIMTVIIMLCKVVDYFGQIDTKNWLGILLALLKSNLKAVWSNYGHLQHVNVETWFSHSLVRICRSDVSAG